MLTIWGLSPNLLDKGWSFHPPRPAPGLCKQVLGESLPVPCPQWGTRGWWAMLDQLAILKEVFSDCSHLPNLILKSRFTAGSFWAMALCLWSWLSPHQPSLPRRAVWNAGGATSLLSREPVADAQCRARPAIATPSDGRCWDRRPPWLIQIGGCRSQSSAMMVCSFLRLPFQVPRHSLPSRPQRGEAAPKRAFCFGRRVLTSMCVALADHTEMGCAT